jgi:hypothetical protein
VKFQDALITAVTLRLNATVYRASDAFPVKPEIMAGTLGVCRANNFLACFVYNQLRFDGVPLFLARIPLPLFFLGRSTGLSVTSTSITSISVFSSKAFLPGSLNFPLFTNVSSAHTT